MGGSQSSGTLNGLSPQLTQLIQQYTSTAAPVASGVEGTLGGGVSTYQGDAAQVGNQLENFQALSPQDIAELSSASGAAVESAGRTAAATSGGVPNPALQNKNLAITAGQQTGQTATQLGEVSAQQNLAAKTAAGSLFSGLSNESLSGILSALGIQEGALNTGVQGQLGVANQQNQQQQEKNQSISSAFGGAASLAGDFLA